MSTNERNQYDQERGNQSQNQNHNNPGSPNSRTDGPTSQSNQEKQWDERSGHQESDPRQQQRNREWEDSQKQQQQNAQNPGEGGHRDNTSDNQRNQDPTRKGENWQEEE